MTVNDPTDGRVFTSVSGLTAHRQCPQKWFYGSVRRLERAGDVAAPDRDFGTWWHAMRAVESFRRGLSLDRPLHYAPDMIDTPGGKLILDHELTLSRVVTACQQWWKSTSTEYREEFESILGGAAPDRLRYVFDRWQEQWAAEIGSEVPLAVELKWQRHLPVIKWAGDLETPETSLLGYIDEVYLDRERNLVVVRDHKAHRSLANRSHVDDMMDSQLQVYAWGASPVINSWGMGKIRATAYDRARVVAPKTPKVTQAGTLSKSVTDYDLLTYQDWCDTYPEYPGRKKDGSEAGVYEAEDSVIEKLSTPTAASVWFQRSLVPLNMNLIKSHLRAACDTAADMAITRARGEEFGQVARDLSRACGWCDFSSLCRAEMSGGPDGDYPLEDHGLKVKGS